MKVVDIKVEAVVVMDRKWWISKWWILKQRLWWLWIGSGGYESGGYSEGGGGYSIERGGGGYGGHGRKWKT